MGISGNSTPSGPWRATSVGRIILSYAYHGHSPLPQAQAASQGATNPRRCTPRTPQPPPTPLPAPWRQRPLPRLPSSPPMLLPQVRPSPRPALPASHQARSPLGVPAPTGPPLRRAPPRHPDWSPGQKQWGCGGTGGRGRAPSGMRPLGDGGWRRLRQAGGRGPWVKAAASGRTWALGNASHVKTGRTKGRVEHGHREGEGTSNGQGQREKGIEWGKEREAHCHHHYPPMHLSQRPPA